ncbi:DUF3016 domain-containing protein [Brucella pseudogrignonensis]|uniref:DUF3016 domain-containing protein n=1 Tax=Brucella pseudogrignonensis TaxID=419475 RepID=UPI001E3C98C6|nr:DUF3016 domain-containing protein [Brucella pseudogrignonensis]MCD4514314.1 DUF3016 domain-containing protein [Brucella pseudogrignonensis]
MRNCKLIATVLISAVLGATGAAASVNITFVNPEHYRDSDFRSAARRESVIAELSRYLERLDRRYLKPGQRVDIEVLDMRLAGEYEPWRRNFDDVRILRDTTPPRLKLRYTFRQGNRVLAQGEETLTDLSYLSNPSARASSERFAYEKLMLREWFRKRFAL